MDNNINNFNNLFNINEEKFREQVKEYINEEKKNRVIQIKDSFNILEIEFSKKCREMQIDFKKELDTERKYTSDKLEAYMNNKQNDFPKKLQKWEDKYPNFKQKENKDNDKEEDENDKKGENENEDINNIKVCGKNKCENGCCEWCEREIGLLKEQNIRTNDDIRKINLQLDIPYSKNKDADEKLIKDSENEQDDIHDQNKKFTDDLNDMDEEIKINREYLDNQIDNFKYEVDKFRELTVIHEDKILEQESNWDKKCYSKDNVTKNLVEEDTNRNNIKNVKETIGLENLGNTCYIASVMQGLLCMDNMGDKFKKANFENIILKDIRDLLTKMQDKDDQASVKNQVNSLNKENKYKKGEQEDVMIFITSLILYQEDEQEKNKNIHI